MVKIFTLFELLVVICMIARPAVADDSTMKIYLLAGQSNMEGQAYTWDNFATVNTWNIPSLDYLTNNQAYYDSLPNDVYSFKEAYGADWMTGTRDDVWSVSYASHNGSNLQVRTTQDTVPGDNSLPNYPTGIQPLSVGFGKNGSIGGVTQGPALTPSFVGMELGMGHNLGDAMNSPIFMFKSARGGTTLAEDWRPPTAVADRGGAIGSNYTNTMNRFVEFLDGLDSDIANGVLGDKYNGATGYEVVGLVWVQGFNEVVENNGAFIPEYDENLVDLVEDIRAADSRIPNDLAAIIVESADQNAALNLERMAAVDALNAADPGTAVFVGTDGLKDVNYGGLNAAGQPFSDNFGSHFHVRPENYLELGYRVGDAILENGWTGSEVVPEPTSLLILGVSGLVLLRRRR